MSSTNYQSNFLWMVLLCKLNFEKLERQDWCSLTISTEAWVNLWRSVQSGNVTFLPLKLIQAIDSRECTVHPQYFDLLMTQHGLDAMLPNCTLRQRGEFRNEFSFLPTHLNSSIGNKKEKKRERQLRPCDSSSSYPSLPDTFRWAEKKINAFTCESIFYFFGRGVGGGNTWQWGWDH